MGCDGRDICGSLRMASCRRYYGRPFGDVSAEDAEEVVVRILRIDLERRARWQGKLGRRVVSGTSMFNGMND